MTKDWRVCGLGWAWGAWCGAGAILAPDLLLLPIFLSGWWLFRRQAPLLFPFWALLAGLSGLWWNRDLPQDCTLAFCDLTEVYAEGDTYRGRGQIFLSAWTSSPCSVRSAPPAPGLYAVSRPGNTLSWVLCEPSSRWRRDWKDWWRQCLQREMNSPRAADLFAAMATGEVEQPSLRALLGRFGMSHLLALSGLHVTLVMQLIGRMFRGFGLFGRALLFAQGVALLLYLVAVGPYASALRAAGMAFLSMLGLAIGRNCSATQTLGITMALLLISDPSLCQHLGFQLSCGATLGLVAWSRPLACLLQRCMIRPEAVSSKLGRFLSALAEVAACNLSVMPLTVPVLLWRFHEFNLLGLWVNALFAPLLAWGFALSLFVPIGSQWLGIPLGVATEWILELLEMPWWWDLWTPPCVISSSACLCTTWVAGLVAMLLKHPRLRLEES
jgi:ComEC/Rec2-related protein